MLAGSIAYSKLSLTGAILNADLAGSIAYSKLTLTGSLVNADISSSAAIAYSKLALTGAILNADLAGSIAYSKLVLTSSIINADISGSAAIAYSKLALTGSIVSGDISGTISIAKGGTGQTTANAALNAFLPSQATANGQVLGSDGTNTLWVTQTGLTNPMTSVGDIIVGGTAGAATRLAIGASGTVLKGGTTPAWASIVNADVSASAAIAYSKLSLSASIVNADIATAAATTLGLNIYDESNSAYRLRISQNGDLNGFTQVFFPNMTQAAATAFPVYWNNATGKLTALTSTIKDKKNVRDSEIDSSVIYHLTAKSFERKDGDDSHTELGYIAEEILPFEPKLVATNAAGEPAGVFYSYVPMLTVEEVKKHETKINDILARLAALEAK
jgi:hypothetical protein